MNEEERAAYKTPWGMPPEIFWEYQAEDAELNRLTWIREHFPELPIDEIQQTMTFTNRALAKAGLGSTVQKPGAESKFLG